MGGHVWLNLTPRPEDERIFRSEIGLPLDMPLVANRFEGGALGNPELLDYTFVVWGCRLRPALLSNEPPVLEMWDGGTLQLARESIQLHHACNAEGWDGDRIVLTGDPRNLADWLQDRKVTEQSLLLVYSSRTYYRDSSVFAEDRQYPFGIPRRSIGGLEHPHTADEVLRADRSFAYMDQLDILLREQPGVKAYDRNEERREIFQVIANLRRDQVKVGRVSLSSRLGLSEYGFDEKRERCGLKLGYLQRLTLEDLAAIGITPK